METLVMKELNSIIPYFLKHKTVWADYDEEVDTLYLHFKKPNVADNSEADGDFILRYENNEIIGITILNASDHTGEVSS